MWMMSMPLSHMKIVFFCDTFKQLTSELGLKLRGDKSKVLTSTNNISPLPFISHHNKLKLTTCFQNYTLNKETTDGIHILGFPIGSPKYISNALEVIYTNVTNTFHKLKLNLQDIQTVTQLVKTLAFFRNFFTH